MVQSPARLGRRVVGLGAVLQETDCLLFRISNVVDREAEAGRHALGLLPTPALALVQGQVSNGVVGFSYIV